MAKYLRQFAESAIAYARKPLFAARLGLVFLYAAAAFLILAWLFGASGVLVLLPAAVLVLGIAASHAMLARLERTIRSHAALISDVSHDLRNSLAVMKMTGEVELLRAGDVLGDESRHFIENELRELDRMLATIERLSRHAFARKCGIPRRSTG